MTRWFGSKPKVTLIGSYHRQPEALKKLFRELEVSGCRVLSPLSLDFDNSAEEFVKLGSEAELSDLEIEKFVLRAIEESDFLWLHAPEGYVGLSGAFEIGYAFKLKKPVFCKLKPQDPNIRNFVITKNSVFDALNLFE